jgi:TonB-linked SusC/RagA family outer membrane protein
LHAVRAFENPAANQLPFILIIKNMKKTLLRRNLPFYVGTFMKYSTIVLLIIGYFSTMVLAAPSYSQILDKSITLHTAQITLPEALDKISNATQARFVLATRKKQDKRISLNVNNVKLRKVLDDILATYELTYTIVGNTIVLKQAPSPKIPAPAMPKKQDNKVKIIDQVSRLLTGTVVDKSRQRLAGASVVVKGANRGVVTDTNGEFSIDVNTGDILIISFIGFLKQELTVGNENALTIQMQEDVAGLNETVVVGYGTQKKINVTGAVSSISGSDYESRPVRNISTALQGLMPGVTVVNNGALPGQNGSTIRIRGIGTLGDSNPLVVIDGIPGGNLDILNPSDVESVSVLKDAASSSIYGVRGANGVIVITTKKGKNDTKPAISYDGYIGMQTPTSLPKFVNSVDYMQLLNEAQVNVGRNPTYTPADIEVARNGSDPNYFANTDWVDALYKSGAPQYNHNLSVSGGAKNLNYFMSYGYLKEGSLIVGDNFNANRHNLRFRLNTTLLDRLQIDLNTGYVDRANSSPVPGIWEGPLYAAHQILPLTPVRFTTGGWGYLGGQDNPVAYLTEGGTDRTASQEFTGNLNATLQLFDGLSLRGQYGLIRGNANRSMFSKTIDYYSPVDNALIYQTNPQNKIDVRNNTTFYQTVLGFLEYEKVFASKHSVRGMLALSQEQYKTNNFSASRTDLASQDVESINLGTANQLNAGSASQNALSSFFGRFNYGYQGKYLAEFNFRNDGSSRFAPDVRRHWFTSASVGWVFSEENFFSPLREVIESGKIRASYGTQGNDKVGSDYAYLATLSPINNTFPMGNQLTIGYAQSGIPNTLLTWESVEKQDIGIDLAMLRGRLGASFDYYIQNTNNILVNVPLPDVLGVSSYPPQNAGKVQNKGWEFQVSWRDQAGDFKYGANFNISDVHNKVTSLGGVPPTLGNQIRIVGQPIDAYYGLVADHIAQTGDFNYDAATNKYTAKFPFITGDPVAPGDIMYKDINGDGKITLDGDRKVIGSNIPRYTYGFRGEFGWKGLDLNFFLQGVGKADGYISGPGRHAFSNERFVPQTVHLDRWTPQNQDAGYPRLTFQQTYNQRLSTFWLENAAYLRLKNIQIGYTLPTGFTEKIRISRLRFYVSADNLFTKTDFFYAYDPESPLVSGNFYPQVKTFVAGMSINLK